MTPPRIKTLLMEQGENARLSKRLATIQLDCPVEFEPEQFRARSPHTDELVGLLRELEFMTLAKTFQPTATQNMSLVGEVVTLHDEAGATQFVRALSDTHVIGLHCVLAGEAGVRAEVQSLAIGTADATAAFVQGGRADWPEPVQELLRKPERTIAMHDLKPALLAFHRQGLIVEGATFDTMIADYLLNPNRRGHTLEALAMDMLGHQLGAAEKAKTDSSPTSLFEADEGLVHQSGEAAVVIAKSVPILTERLKEQGSLTLFKDVEMPLVSVLAEIERNGFLLDVASLEQLNKELERELENMAGGIARLAGGEFNINSPKQLATVLFEKLGLKPVRKTKTGYSTDEETLTQLATQHEFPAQILNYRTLSKLKSTYVDALPQLVNPETRRLHTSLNQTVAATGRLSSTDPNLQNIPVKGEYGLRIREAFIAPPGHILALCRL